MTQEPRPTPLLWRLEYLRKWYGQQTPIRFVKWFESERAASLHRAEIANRQGEVISMEKYAAVDPSYVLPDPPRSLTPEQVERAKFCVTKHDNGVYGPNTLGEAIQLLREVVGDE